jgi:hypothetical protein
MDDMPIMFINYRAKEQAGYAALLDRELAERFGRDAVFRASRSIRPGDDFAREILDNLRRCRVLLAVIGPEWLAFNQRDGDPSGAEPDWVRREISEALARGIRVIPILVEDAKMPAEAELSADIAALARCQYLRLHHRNIDNDIGRVVDELVRLLPDLGAGRRHPREVTRRDVRLFTLADMPSLACRIGLVTGTIRHVEFADVWVNSENTDMEMSRFTEFSVSGIIRYWGARRDATGRVTDDVIANELAAVVGERRPVVPGSAFVTGAGALAQTHNVRYVIHVASVQGEPGAGFRPVPDIGRCVSSALAEAERLANDGKPVRTILFPLLGTGTAGAELRPTITALLRSTVRHLDTTPVTSLRAIYFLTYNEEELAVFEDVVRGLPRLAPAA